MLDVFQNFITEGSGCFTAVGIWDVIYRQRSFDFYWAKLVTDAFLWETIQRSVIKDRPQNNKFDNNKGCVSPMGVFIATFALLFNKWTINE